MEQRTTKSMIGAISESEILQSIRAEIREGVEKILEEEVAAALGALKSERSEERRGYRNGAFERTVTTERGEETLRVPRARVREEDGTTSEWRSEMLPAYQRRTQRVDEAILGIYLAGANTRRIRKALAPLLGASNLSKSAISRVVARLKALFEAWRSRDLSQETYLILFLDALFLSVRIARRVVSVPVQIALGIREDGQKVVLGMQVALTESTSDWTEMVRSLGERGLADPLLVVMDGAPGLRAAVKTAWSTSLVQRCTEHKYRNLKKKVPMHAHEELRRDYRAITHALSPENGLRAYDAFLAKWSKLCPEAAKSLQEAGLELLTFFRFPRSLWRALRTTNGLERLNEEFRRRVKTQGAMPNETSALTLLYGLIAFGQIRLKKIGGFRAVATMREVVAEKVA